MPEALRMSDVFLSSYDYNKFITDLKPCQGEKSHNLPPSTAVLGHGDMHTKT